MSKYGFAIDYPVGFPKRGLYDPATAIGVSAGLGGLSAALGADANSDAITEAERAERIRLAELKPFRIAGKEALPEFQGNIGSQPTYADIVAGLSDDPGYRFELEQGQQAIEGSAAAGGMLRSGRTLKDLAKYAQGLASTRAGDAFTRELNAFNNKQNQLLNLVQIGATASGAPSALPQLALQQGQNRADLFTNIANTGSNALSNLALMRMLNPGAVAPLGGTVGGSGLSANSMYGGIA